MNIAICDDDITVLGLLEKIIDECFMGDGRLYQCDAYTSGDELLKYYEQQSNYQIFLLDIEMPGRNGLEVATRIRENDRNAVIIFVTSHQELMQKAFDVLAFNYLIKPIQIDVTKRVLFNAIDFINIKKTVFHFKHGKNMYQLNYEDIECFESDKRKIYVHTDRESLEFYGKLSEVMDELSTQYFAQLHNSYIVNMEKIHSVCKESLIMKSGREILITRKYAKSFNDRYRNFILRRRDS